MNIPAKERARVVFSAVREPQAKALADGLAVIRTSHAIEFAQLRGIWAGRRFVLESITPTHPRVGENFVNVEKLSLTISTSENEKSAWTKLRSFGARVERHFRDRDKSLDDEAAALANDSDSRMHRLRPHHHVSACGLKGPWRDPPSTVAAANAGLPAFVCARCFPLAYSFDDVEKVRGRSGVFR